MNLKLVVPGVIGFVAVGSLTWLRGNPVFDRSAWDLLGPLGALREGLKGHFGMFYWTREIAPTHIVVSLILGFIIVGFLAVQLRCRQVFEALILMFIGLFTTVAISAISAISSYWILSRQWVGGMAITTVAVVWLLAASWEKARIQRYRVSQIVVALSSIVIVVNGLLQIQGSLRQIPAWIDESSDITQDEIDFGEMRVNSGEDDIDLTEMAKLNVLDGGKIWPGFVDYYDGYR